MSTTHAREAAPRRQDVRFTCKSETIQGIVNEASTTRSLPSRIATRRRRSEKGKKTKNGSRCAAAARSSCTRLWRHDAGGHHQAVVRNVNIAGLHPARPGLDKTN